MASMRALVLKSSNQPLVEEQVPVPELCSGDVLIRPRVVGICGTDLKIASGRLPGIALPLIPGHEIAGEVVASGHEVQGLKEGDRVTLHPRTTCGRFDYCRTGRHSACVGGKRRLGFEMDGGLADFVRVPAQNALLIPDNVPFDQAAIVPDAVAVPWHGIRGRSQLRPGEVALIVGVSDLGHRSICYKA